MYDTLNWFTLSYRLHCPVSFDYDDHGYQVAPLVKVRYFVSINVCVCACVCVCVCVCVTKLANVTFASN